MFPLFTMLTHFHLDKMASISQMTFSNAFFLMKSFVSWFKFHWTLFLNVQLTVSTVSGNGLAPNRRQVIIWTNADPVHKRIYVALGGGELRSRTHTSWVIIYLWQRLLCRDRLSAGVTAALIHGERSPSYITMTSNGHHPISNLHNFTVSSSDCYG